MSLADRLQDAREALYDSLDIDNCPTVAVPTRLLALLIEYDSCAHVTDYVCGVCSSAAVDILISILEATNEAAA